MNRSCSLSKTEINQKPMHVVPDPLLFGLSSPKTFTLRNMTYTLSFCAEPKAKLQNPSSKRSPLPSGRGLTSQKVGDGQTKILFLTPHPPWRAHSPQEKGVPSLNVSVDSATPGKPCVQNDM